MKACVSILDASGNVKTLKLEKVTVVRKCEGIGMVLVSGEESLWGSWDEWDEYSGGSPPSDWPVVETTYSYSWWHPYYYVYGPQRVEKNPFIGRRKVGVRQHSLIVDVSRLVLTCDPDDVEAFSALGLV